MNTEATKMTEEQEIMERARVTLEFDVRGVKKSYEIVEPSRRKARSLLRALQDIINKELRDMYDKKGKPKKDVDQARMTVLVFRQADAITDFLLDVSEDLKTDTEYIEDAPVEQLIVAFRQVAELLTVGFRDALKPDPLEVPGLPQKSAPTPQE